MSYALYIADRNEVTKWSLSIQMNYDWFLWEITREKIAENRYQIIFKTTALLEFRNLFRCIEYHHNHTKIMRWSASNCYNNDDVWSIERCSSNSKVLLLFFVVNNCNTCAIMTNTDQINWTTLLRCADLSSIDQRFFAQPYYVYSWSSWTCPTFDLKFKPDFR